ncbi:MAG: NUDIX hydrolase [Gemmatimonadota bacterium]
MTAEDRPTAGRIGGRLAYEGRVLDVHVDRVRLPNGAEGELEIIRHVGAAAVVPVLRPGEWDGTGPGVILLRQYRYAAGGMIWEVPAGKLDAGESPVDCARRELEEEAGVRAREIRPLTRIFTTPGFTDEQIHLFAALGLERTRSAHGALEVIERHEMPLERALAMIGSGEIRDAKTLCALLFAARFHANGGFGEAEPCNFSTPSSV